MLTQGSSLPPFTSKNVQIFDKVKLPTLARSKRIPEASQEFHFSTDKPKFVVFPKNPNEASHKTLRTHATRRRDWRCAFVRARKNIRTRETNRCSAEENTSDAAGPDVGMINGSAGGHKERARVSNFVAPHEPSSAAGLICLASLNLRSRTSSTPSAAGTSQTTTARL